MSSLSVIFFRGSEFVSKIQILCFFKWGLLLSAFRKSASCAQLFAISCTTSSFLAAIGNSFSRKKTNNTENFFVEKNFRLNLMWRKACSSCNFRNFRSFCFRLFFSRTHALSSKSEHTLIYEELHQPLIMLFRKWSFSFFKVRRKLDNFQIFQKVWKFDLNLNK